MGMGKHGARRQRGRSGRGPANPSSDGRGGGILAEAWERARVAWRERPILRFLALFFPFLLVFYLCWTTSFFQVSIFEPYLILNAHAAAGILAVLGQETGATGTTLFSNEFSMQVKRGCDAIEPSALFAAAVFAFPAALRRKAIGIAAGIGFLMVLNLVRIVTLYFFGVHAPDLFHVVHVDVWQALFIFLALLTWVLWARWAVRAEVLAHAAQ
jgi:exosortase H (IPTLxxWG-CTERM-specific)